MKANNRSTAMLVGGILLILHGVIRIFIMREYIVPITVIYYLGFIALGIGLVSGILYICIGGAAVSALLEVYWTFRDIQDAVNFGFYDSWWLWPLVEILICVALVLLIVMMIPLLSKKPGGSPGGMARMWYLPGLVAAIGFVPQLVSSLSWYFSGDGFMFMFTHIACFIVGMFLAGNGLSKVSFSSAYPSQFGPGRQMPGYGNPPYGNQPQAPGYGAPPYGGQPQAPGYGAPGYGNAPYGSAPQAPGYGAPQGAPVTPIQPATPVTPVAPAPSVPSATMTGLSTENVEAMMKYKQLLDAGIISQAEFDELKKKLLG